MHDKSQRMFSSLRFIFSMQQKAGMTIWKNYSVKAQPADTWRAMNVANGKCKVTEPSHIERSWRLVSNTLVSTPGSSFFLNPLRIERLGARIFLKWKRSQILTIAIVATGLIAAAVFGGVRGKFIDFELLLLCFEGLLVTTFAVSLSSERLAERSEFLSSVLRNSRRLVALPCIVCFTALAASGFFLVPYDTSANAIGAVVPKVLAGQYWRILTGSFVHYNIAYWVGNSVGLFFTFPLAGFYNKWNAVLVFFSGLIVSQACFIVLSSHGFINADILDGMSGGIFALLGYTTADAVVHARKYPETFWLSIVSISLFLLLCSRIVDPSVSDVAHLSGYALGLSSVFFVKSPQPT